MRVRDAMGKFVEQRENPIISDDCRQVLLGSIIGDGCLSHGNGINYYLEETHSKKQREYLAWKNTFLKELNAKMKQKIFLILGKRYEGFKLQTSSFPFLTEYRKLFYHNSKKTISIRILNQINELGLAVWYLDDGHVVPNTNLITLSTDSFSHKEHIIIRRWLKKQYGVYPKISKRGGKYYYMCFGRKDSDIILSIFKEIFSKYNVPKSMWYKLGYFWRGNELKIKIARKKHNHCRRIWRRKKSKIRKKQKEMKIRKLVEQIKYLYWERGLSTPQISEIVKYSPSRVRYYMKKYNIPIRTRSEAYSGERNGFYGRHHTKESKEKISENRWGKLR